MTEYAGNPHTQPAKQNHKQSSKHIRERKLARNLQGTVPTPALPCPKALLQNHTSVGSLNSPHLIETRHLPSPNLLPGKVMGTFLRGEIDLTPLLKDEYII